MLCLWFVLYSAVRVSFTGVEGAGLVLGVGGPPDASFGFYLREAFQSQTNTEEDFIQR